MLALIFVNKDEDITKGRQPERCAGGKDSEREGVKVSKREKDCGCDSVRRLGWKAMGINRRVGPSSLLVLLLHARFLPPRSALRPPQKSFVYDDTDSRQGEISRSAVAACTTWCAT